MPGVAGEAGHPYLFGASYATPGAFFSAIALDFVSRIALLIYSFYFVIINLNLNIEFVLKI